MRDKVEKTAGQGLPFARTFIFGNTLHFCNLAEPIPILWVRLCELRAVGGAGLSSPICLPSVLFPPPISFQAQRGTCSSQNTAPSSTSIPSGPADMTCICCLPACQEPLFNCVWIIYVAHSHYSSKIYTQQYSTPMIFQLLMELLFLFILKP